MEMTKGEEQMIQNQLEEVFGKFGVSQLECQKQLKHHMEDPKNSDEIMRITQQVLYESSGS